MGKSNKVFIISTKEEFEYICKIYPTISEGVNSSYYKNTYTKKHLNVNDQIYVRTNTGRNSIFFDKKEFVSSWFDGESDIIYFNNIYDSDYELIYVGDMILFDEGSDNSNKVWDISSLI